MTEGQRAGDDRPPDRPAPPEGLGRSSAAGPGFRTGDPLPPAPRPPWSTPGPPPASPPPPRSARPGPPPVLLPPRRSRLPTLLGVAVVVVVLAVVAVSSAVARYADSHPAGPAPVVPLPAATATTDPGSIEFTTARGSGRLVLVDHTWEPGRPGAAPRSRHLRIRVELLCTRGSVGHAPEFFSLFDDRGRLVEASLAVVEPDPVPQGTLGPGERVRGHVAFDLPRGDVTLVMSDEVSSVTAIRVPG